MSKKQRKNKHKWNNIRFLIQFFAFFLILIAPFLNYYFHINFIQGWYQSISIGRLWFVSPLEGLESILTSKLIYLPLLIGMAFPILIAFFLGRLFCAWICPISFLSELIDKVIIIFSKKRYRKDTITLPRRVFWFSFLGEIILAMILGTPIFVFLSPPGLVGREIMMAVFFHTLVLEGVIIFVVLILHLFTRRFFCRYLCPLGALLGIIGAKRRLIVVRDTSLCNKCGMCKKACPLGLNPIKGESLSAYCWNCGECIDACSKEALTFYWKDIKIDYPYNINTHQVQMDKNSTL